MADIIQDDRYLAAKQGDGNFVVYRRADMVPLWDRWTYEATHGEGPKPVEPEPVFPVPFPPFGQFGRKHLIGGGFRPRMYSYWPNAWVHADGATFVFAGNPSGPRFYRIDPTGAIADMGPMVRYPGETEGWYWDATGHVYIIDGGRFLRVNPFTQEEEVVMQAPDGHYLWQPHSSDDGQVHSATLKDGNWNRVGTIFNYRGRTDIVKADGDLDESILTKCGEWLVIQEDRYNRIIVTGTGGEAYRISQEEGAVGHCDTWHGLVIGEDDAHGACVVWDLAARTRRELWNTWNMGHVSVQAGRLLSSDTESLTLVDMNTGSMRHVLSHGGRVTPDMSPEQRYDAQVRANLSPCGRRATYMVNGQVFVVEL